MKAVVVLPAYNEASVIRQVIANLPKKLNGISSLEYVVINDGSTDQTGEMAKKEGIKVLSHIINRGLGAAIKTGIDYAKSQKADLLVTFDSDGQHNPRDLQKVINPILQEKADLVIGSRFKNYQKAPLDRLIINKLANLATLVFFGVSTTDSQSGLRSFSKKALQFIDFRADKMDFSSEILLEAKRHNLKVSEVPIDLIYTQYSREKGQKNINSLSVFAKLLVRLYR